MMRKKSRPARGRRKGGVEPIRGRVIRLSRNVYLITVEHDEPVGITYPKGLLPLYCS